MFEAEPAMFALDYQPSLLLRLDGDCPSAWYDANWPSGTQLVALRDEEKHSSNAADGRGSITVAVIQKRRHPLGYRPAGRKI